MTDRDLDDFGEFLIEYGMMSAAIAPWLIMIGNFLRTGKISDDDFFKLVLPSFASLLLREYYLWSRRRSKHRDII